MAGTDPQDSVMCGRHDEAIKRLDGWQAAQNGSIHDLRKNFAAFAADYSRDQLAGLRASRNTLITVLLNLLGVIVTLGLVILRGGG
jgi:hypothetical protein